MTEEKLGVGGHTTKRRNPDGTTTYTIDEEGTLFALWAVFDKDIPDEGRGATLKSMKIREPLEEGGSLKVQFTIETKDGN